MGVNHNEENTLNYSLSHYYSRANKSCCPQYACKLVYIYVLTPYAHTYISISSDAHDAPRMQLVYLQIPFGARRGRRPLTIKRGARRKSSRKLVAVPLFSVQTPGFVLPTNEREVQAQVPPFGVPLLRLVA